jgi:Flp pilus assembly pilin Flp
MDMKMIRGITKKITEERGAAAVEFAIILPLLVVFLFGIIEFSLMLYDKAVITNASREGARYGILFTPDPRIPIVDTGGRKGITTKVEDYCEDYLVTFGTATGPVIEVDLEKPDGTLINNSSCVEADDELIVTVTYHYDFLLVPDMLAAFFSGGAFTGGSDIQAVSRMRCE